MLFRSIISHVSEVGISHQNNYDIDQPDIVDLLVNDFSSTFHEWRDLYPTGLPIIAKYIGCGTLDDLNTPIYTIPKYFVGIPSNISPRVSGLLNILRCSTMIVTNGIKMFLFPGLCFRKIGISLVGKKGLLTVCL